MADIRSAGASACVRRRRRRRDRCVKKDGVRAVTGEKKSGDESEQGRHGACRRPGPICRYRQKSREEYSAGDSIHKKTRQRRKPRRGRPGANDGGETAEDDGDGGFRDHSCRKGMRAASERARNQSARRETGRSRPAFTEWTEWAAGKNGPPPGPVLFVCAGLLPARPGSTGAETRPKAGPVKMCKIFSEFT